MERHEQLWSVNSSKQTEEPETSTDELEKVIQPVQTNQGGRGLPKRKGTSLSGPWRAG
jgi:hypothetical protein